MFQFCWSLWELFRSLPFLCVFPGKHGMDFPTLLVMICYEVLCWHGLSWTVVALWRWTWTSPGYCNAETLRNLQAGTAAKCRNATLTWDYVRLLNSKWWDQILLKFEMNNDWTSQIFRWSVAMNQFWINGKATVLNSVAGPTYSLLPTGLVAAETATATWGVLLRSVSHRYTVQGGCWRPGSWNDVSSEQLGVTCSLNILFVPSGYLT